MESGKGPGRAGPPGRQSRLHRSLERSVLLLVLIAGLPAALALFALTWGTSYSFEVRWTIATVVLVV